MRSGCLSWMLDLCRNFVLFLSWPGVGFQCSWSDHDLTHAYKCASLHQVSPHNSPSQNLWPRNRPRMLRERFREIFAPGRRASVCLPELVLQCLHIPLAWDTRGPHTNALRSQSLIEERGRIWERLPGPRLWTHLESCGQCQDRTQISRDRQAQTFTIPPSTTLQTDSYSLRTFVNGAVKMGYFTFWPPRVIGNCAELVQYNFCEAPSCTEQRSWSWSLPSLAPQNNSIYLCTQSKPWINL